jgi:hypothetical protein
VCILDCWYACIWRSSLQRVYRHACICLHHDLAEDKCLCSVCVCVCVWAFESIEGPKSAQIYKSMHLMQTCRRQRTVMDELWAGFGLISIHQQRTMNPSRPLWTRACYSWIFRQVSDSVMN